MARTGVPTEIRSFIAAEIESVEQLEVLLLVRGAADKWWTAAEVARALVSHVDSAARWLERMAGSDLLECDGDQYRYAPRSRQVDRMVDGLAESFAKYRVTVISLIFSKPSEHMNVFADAFRIRREKE